MAWASWTTTGVFTGPGGVRTDEAGVITGELDVHTTWFGSQAQVAVQYSGASDWFTVSGSPVDCPSERDSRNLHELVIEGVRAGALETVPRRFSGV
ncbi:hypothetical protein GCM10020367_56250 [Streptomyces sannanensis]|uniref:Uncharacterized protein n=1 Tax=Streptomyces sannanensis TaxID=285536 RepID=A0ABP6SJQ1_9ACTN